MLSVELNENEAVELRSMLESDLIDLRREIAHTDLRRAREMLRRREQIVESLIHKLGAAELREKTVAVHLVATS